VMDRYLSSGKFRPSMLMLYDIRLQLPCSQNAFLFGDRVCTEYIDGTCSKAGERLKRKAQDYRRWMQRTKGVTDGRGVASSVPRLGLRPDAEVEVQVSCETGPVESVLSVHVRMVEIWGRIAKWSCAGGIRYVMRCSVVTKLTFLAMNDTRHGIHRPSSIACVIHSPGIRAHSRAYFAFLKQTSMPTLLNGPPRHTYFSRCSTR
jgi:hypothetical protein